MTILFADVAGSTSLQERLDPESARRDMDRVFALLRDRTGEHAGRVVKYTGDGLMAVFGIPEVAEDDAVRAVRCAGSMQESFAALADEIDRTRGTRIALRVGVNTGEVVVPMASDDVVGDAVNVANRLQDAAGPGGVLVGEETWRLARDDMTFTAGPPLALRGRSEAVHAFHLASLEPGAVPSTQFVGRARELAAIAQALEETVATREPRVVTVIGAPGLGKSRLAAHFVATSGAPAAVVEVRCGPSSPSALAPVAEALRSLADVPESASDAEILDAFVGLAPGGDDGLRIATVAASLLGAAEEASSEETFWAVRRLLESSADGRPVLLIVDDAQWATPQLVGLVEHLVEWTQGAGLLVLVLSRPEVRDVYPALTTPAGRIAAVIALEGFDPDAAGAFTAGLLGSHDVPEDLSRRFHEITEGNPLFLRELLRMLVERGVLRREGDGWSAAVDVTNVDVPPTIHALLAARIERLQAGERSVIERASVVGQEFYRGAVRDLVPSTVRGEIDSHLETLRRKELVETEGTVWIDEPVFHFHHVLIRDAAYRRLLKEARADLHERFATWLESKLGYLAAEHDEVIGYHLEQAHEYLRQLGPLDALGKDIGYRAGRRLGSAAHRALRRDDLAAAANLSGRALERLAPDDPARAGVLLDRCEAVLAIEDTSLGAAATAELNRLADDERLRAWAECFIVELDILTASGPPVEGAERAAAAAGVLERLGDPAGAAKGYSVNARALRRLGRFGDSEAALDLALAAARGASDRRRTNAVLAGLPLVALWGPSPVGRASGRCLDVVRAVRITRGAPAVEAVAGRCHAVLEALAGRGDGARRLLAGVRTSLQDLGLRHALLQTEMFAGIIESVAGNEAGAALHLRRAYDGFQSRGVAGDTAQAAALLARSLLAMGGGAEAEALTAEAERLGGSAVKTQVAWRSVRAEALARRGSIDDAVRFAREAVAIAEQTDALLDHGEARASLAAVFRAAKRDAEADAEAQRATELFQRKEATAKAPSRSAVAVAHLTPSDAPSPARTAHDRYVAAYNACDWTAMRAVLHDDFVVTDHRLLSLFAHTGADGWVRMLTTMFSSAPEQGRVARWVEAAPDVGMAELVQTGRVGDVAGGVEQRLLIVVASAGGRMTRAEVFDPSDEAAALAQMNELAQEK